MINKDKLTVLSLDLGTTTGWALLKANGTVVRGTVSFKNKRFEGGGMRYLRFGNWLDEVRVSVGEVNKLYFEEVRRHIGTDAAHVYGGFMATLTAWCEANSIPYSGVPVGTIKKHATGKGNASKADVIKAMVALGYEPRDDNEADALALLHYAQQVG